MDFTVAQIISAVVVTIVGFVIGFRQGRKKASSVSKQNDENITDKEE